MDLTTTYMGMDLENPIVPSASPLSETLDGIRCVEDAGAAALVMYSLFEEQVTAAGSQLATTTSAMVLTATVRLLATSRAWPTTTSARMST